MERDTYDEREKSTMTNSPTTTTSSNCYNGGGALLLGQRPSPRPVSRSELNPYPVTFVQANAATFKQIVQMLTGPVNPAAAAASSGVVDHSIRPVRTVQKQQQQQQGFKLYERRRNMMMKNNTGLTISPLRRNSGTVSVERLSPSILDFPSLALLSPVTPLTGAGEELDSSEEEKAIAEKGFYLHPSPRRQMHDEQPPRLLPLFPVTSPTLVSSSESKT